MADCWNYQHQGEEEEEEEEEEEGDSRWLYLLISCMK